MLVRRELNQAIRAGKRILRDQDKHEYRFNREVTPIWLVGAIVGILVIGLVFFSGCAWSEDHFQYYFQYIDLHKISIIESHGEESAYNPMTHATGIYQITPIVVKDYNKYHIEKYDIESMFDSTISYKVAYWYLNIRIPQLLRHYNLPTTMDYYLISYNAGIRIAINHYKHNAALPKETVNYINKYNCLQPTTSSIYDFQYEDTCSGLIEKG